MFAADSVSVPEPVFVTVPELVAIGSATVNEPVLASNVRSWVPLNALPLKTSNVKLPASACTSAAAANVTRPVSVFTPETLRIAPTSAELTVTPSPEIVRGSAELMFPESSSVALFATVVAPDVVPRAFACEIATTPAETVVEPL